MKPRIVISKSQEKLSEHVSDVVRELHIPPYHIFDIRPLKTEITIDQVRSIKREIITSSARHKRLFVLYGMDNANLEAQNAMLKTLEEKNEDNIFLLLAENGERLLPTIRSRSQVIDLDTGDRLHFQLRPQTQLFLDDLWGSDRYAFLGSPAVTGITREDALVLLDEITVYFHARFKKDTQYLMPLVKKILQTKQLLQNNNLNPQLAIDGILINIQTNLRHARQPITS